MIPPRNNVDFEHMGETLLLPVEHVDVSPKPWHSRGDPTEEDVESFADMLRSNEPIQHPILVRPNSRPGKRYELVAG